MAKTSKPVVLPIALVIAAILLVAFTITIKTGQFLQGLEDQSKNSQKYVDLVKFFGGYDSPQKTLLIMANNAELRFGGGFIGSVGLISSANGKVTSQPIQSIYGIDSDTNNVHSKYKPPSYMNTLTKVLGMRDSNTEPNWPDDAQRAIYYYQLNTGQRVDNVVQITPNVVDALLEKLGPVYLKQYDLTVTHDNFREKVQLEVESGKDKQQKLDPKSGILGELANVLLDRMLQKDVSELRSYLPLFEKLIAEKQLLAYSTNPAAQQNIEKLGLSGKLQQTDDNYLMYAEANIVANKDSPYIKNSIHMAQSIQPDGSSLVETTVSSTLDTDYQYQYLDPNINKKLWLIGDDISYVKLLLPSGAQVLSMSAQKNQKPMQLEQVQSEVAEGKYTFGYLRRLAPHETQITTVRYSVPTHYFLGNRVVINSLVQKQPGGWPYDLRYSLSLPGEYSLSASSVAPVTKPIGAEQPVRYNGRVSTDTLLSFIYAKN